MTNVANGKLDSIVRLLDAYQIRLLCEVGEALLRPVQSQRVPDSDIATEDFARYFENVLKIHHSMHEEKFNKKAFEYAFKTACSIQGKRAFVNSDSTDPGFDVEVDGVRFSLKTEAAKGISDDKITISKLMEARWIRECKAPADFARESRKRIGKHLGKYDRIIMLRAFDLPDGKVRYSLIEIPVDLLKSILDLKARDFDDPTPNGGTSAIVNYRGVKAFTLRLDGSVEKITISGLQMSLCQKHAEWILPVTISP